MKPIQITLAKPTSSFTENHAILSAGESHLPRKVCVFYRTGTFNSF
jgi:hypothetical protein